FFFLLISCVGNNRRSTSFPDKIKKLRRSRCFQNRKCFYLHFSRYNRNENGLGTSHSRTHVDFSWNNLDADSCWIVVLSCKNNQSTFFLHRCRLESLCRWCRFGSCCCCGFPPFS